MKNDFKLICVVCGKSKPKREIKKLKTGLTCGECIRKKRKEHREFLKRDICGIRKREDILKEAKKKREKSKRLREIVMPTIKVAKNLMISRQNYLYLTKEEKKVLYLKAIKFGMSSEEASKRVNELSLRMNKLAIKLRKKIKDAKELNKRFKEEFAKMCESLK